jgi:hypothetical protein
MWYAIGTLLLIVGVIIVGAWIESGYDDDEDGWPCDDKFE